MMLFACMLVSIALACPPPARPQEAFYATRYAIGVMKRVAKKRGIPWPVSNCGMALDDQPLGSFVEVIGVRTGVRRVCAVIDYSGPLDKARHVRNHLSELDSNSQAAVCGKDAALSGWRECPVLIRRLKAQP